MKSAIVVLRGAAVGLALGLSLASGALSAAPHEHGDEAASHDSASADSASANSAHGHKSHDGHGHAAPTFDDINWVEGLFGGRSESTPVPLVALLANTAILFFLLIKFGGPKIAAGLVSRRNRLAADIDAAAQVHKEAEAQLAHYQQKLDRADAEGKEIESAMREIVALERERVLREAEATREALLADARQRVEREFRLRREAMLKKIVSDSVRGASDVIQQNIQERDQTWYGERILSEAARARGANV